MKNPILALVLAIVHGLSGLAILLVSSWFIAASAVATPQFNYLLPAVAIRGLALLRIASGYSEMWLSHYQLLEKLAKTRLLLFKKLNMQDSITRGAKTDQLSYQTEELASVWASWVNQNATAIISLFLITILSLVMFQEVSDIWGWFVFGTLSIYACLIMLGRRLAIQKLKTRAELEHKIEHHFNAADIWHMHHNIKQLSGSELYSLSQKSQRLIENSIGLLLLLSLGLLCLLLIRSSTDGLYQPVHLVLPMVLLAAIDWFGKCFYSANRIQDYRLARSSLMSMHAKKTEKRRNTEAVNSIKLRQFGAKSSQVAPINLDLCKGELILISGSSGVGKSQLLKAISGLTSSYGAKKVNNSVIANDSLFDDILYLEQFPYCLAGTLRQNLLLANQDASDSQLKHVLKQVNLVELTDLEQWVGTGGRTLSGGELKRLGLARALLSNKNVLLLDEPFEALDPANIDNLVPVLNQLKGDKIILIASHVLPCHLKIDNTINLERAFELNKLLSQPNGANL